MNLIEVISIPVTDQKAAKDFYEKIGFHLIVEAPMGDGNVWVQLGLPDQATSISLVTWFSEMTPGCIQGIVLSTDDIEKEVAELKAKGVNVKAIDDTPWGRFASFNDPDGNGMTLREDVKA